MAFKVSINDDISKNVALLLARSFSGLLCRSQHRRSRFQPYALVSIQVTDKLSPSLAAMAARLKNKRPVLEAMGETFRSIAVRSFTDEAMRPAPWAPLKPATVKRKKGAGGILRNKGAMWQSLKVTPLKLSNDSVTVSSDRPYAAFHQFGTKYIPARPFFPMLNGKLTPSAKEKIVNIAKLKIKILLK